MCENVGKDRCALCLQWSKSGQRRVQTQRNTVATPSSLIEKKLHEECRCTDHAIAIARNTVINQNDKSTAEMLDFKREIVTVISTL